MLGLCRISLPLSGPVIKDYKMEETLKPIAAEDRERADAMADSARLNEDEDFDSEEEDQYCCCDLDPIEEEMLSWKCFCCGKWNLRV